MRFTKEQLKIFCRAVLKPLTGILPNLILVKGIVSIDKELKRQAKKNTLVRKQAHTKASLTRREPTSITGISHWKFADHAPGIIWQSYATFYYQLQNVRVYGESGNVITDENLVIDTAAEKSCDNAHYDHYLLRTIAYKKLLRLNGKVLLLTAENAQGNYFHWMTDALPKLEIMNKAGFSISDFDFILVGNKSPSYVNETMSNAGLHNSKVISLSEHPYISCQTLFVTSPTCLSGNVSPWITGYLHNLFNGSSKNALSDNERLYITRKHATKRRLINEDEVFTAISDFHFRKVFLEDLTVQDQANLFRQAKIIIGVHGAGFTNLTFCSPDATVVEFFSPTYVNQCYWTIASHARLNYYYLVSDGEDNTTSSEHLIENDLYFSKEKIHALKNFLQKVCKKEATNA